MGQPEVCDIIGLFDFPNFSVCWLAFAIFHTWMALKHSAWFNWVFEIPFQNSPFLSSSISVSVAILFWQIWKRKFSCRCLWFSSHLISRVPSFYSLIFLIPLHNCRWCFPVSVLQNLRCFCSSAKPQMFLWAGHQQLKHRIISQCVISSVLIFDHAFPHTSHLNCFSLSRTFISR